MPSLSIERQSLKALLACFVTMVRWSIAPGADYVNTVETGRLYAVPIGPGGDAGAAVQLGPPRRLDHPDGMRSHGSDSMLPVEGGSPGRLSELRIAAGHASLTTLREGFPDDAVAVTVVGQSAYVLEAQWRALAHDAQYPPKPFHATAVSLASP